MNLRQFSLCGMASLFAIASISLLETQSAHASEAAQVEPVSNTITLRIVATNADGVDVLVNGKTRGLTPLNLKLAQSNKAITMAFKKKGYYSKELRVTPHRARTIKVKLSKIPPPPKKKDPRENLPF